MWIIWGSLGGIVILAIIGGIIGAIEGIILGIKDIIISRRTRRIK